jgi:hypothetical protein
MVDRAMVVSFRWGLLLRDHNDEGNWFMLTLVGGGWQQGLATVGRLGWPLVMMCAASGSAPSSRTGWEPFLRPPLAPWLTQLLQEKVKDRIWRSLRSVFFDLRMKFKLDSPVFIGVFAPMRRELGDLTNLFLSRLQIAKDKKDSAWG